MERRELLYGSAGALAVAVAGCTGRAQEGDDTDGNETSDETSNETGGGEETTDGSENGTDESGTDNSDDGTAGEESGNEESDSEGGPDADYDGDVEGITGFDADGFSVGGDAMTVDWMACEEGVLVVNGVVDTSREDLLKEVPMSAEGLGMLAEMDAESISSEDVESMSAEEIEPMLEAIEPMLMDTVESVPTDTVESIDDMDGFSTDIHEVRVTLCDETGTELLSFTIDVDWMLEVVADLMTDEELVARVRETAEYLVEDDELVERVIAAAEDAE
ncbi:hypothetical protein [Saliphagus sp. LR7]|uniref:hypothetical protein n=1 Tax=Saliphagus sp. LR7 TaxID=2282654 RepID=UPI000DF739C7|nr:hypothetical protein [Saliphagus sp. LR7]